MFQSSNIWQQITPSQNSSSQTLFAKKLNKIKVCIQDKSSIRQIYTTPNKIKNKRKRGRRNLKSGEEYEVALHTKDNDDNIKRKVKTHFHNFIVAYLNMLIKSTIKTKRQYKFRKMSSKITQDITISYNKKLMETPVKDILVQVSHKFKNKDINLYYIEKIAQIKGVNPINNANINFLNEILNLPYKDMMNNFYLKSTKKLFENESNDESFEKHIENLMNKYGYNYAMKFKENAENFVNFYINSKQRNHKNNSDIFYLSSSDKENHEIQNLKLFLNNKENDILNSKNEKKFFEIVRDNSTGDTSKCNTILTQSQSGSCDGVSEQEENEKNEKEEKGTKIFLNKKRSGLFNVLLLENENEK